METSAVYSTCLMYWLLRFHSGTRLFPCDQGQRIRLGLSASRFCIMCHGRQIRPSYSCCHRSDNNTDVIATRWSTLISELISIKECFFGGCLASRVTVPWLGGENLPALLFRNELNWIVEACNDPPVVWSLLLTFKTCFKDLRCHPYLRLPGSAPVMVSVFTIKLFSTPNMLIREPQIGYVSAYTSTQLCLLSRSKEENWWKPAHVAKRSTCGKEKSAGQAVHHLRSSEGVRGGGNVIYNSLSTPTSRSSHIGKTR